MRRYGVVEIGGTKTSWGIGSSPADLSGVTTIVTTDPAETLDRVIAFLSDVSPDAVGIASFGPLRVPEGQIGLTPKSGWSNTDLVGPVRDALGVPVGLDTDVNGAALGEARWGAGEGLYSFAYVTVGTGIGGGVLVAEEPMHGLGHPEMGHLTVRRHPEDRLDGVCPFHGDCLEGLASGPAIERRSGAAGEDLTGADLTRAVQIEAFYLAQMMRTIVYILAPQRIVVGGGVSQMPGLLDLVSERLTSELAGYPGLSEHGSGFVVPPGLGSRSALAGGLVLAERARSSG